MIWLPAFGALLFLVAGVALADGGERRRPVARGLSAVGLLTLLVPTLAPLPFVVLAAAAVPFPGALACAVASAGAIGALLTAAPPPSLGVLAAILAALALSAVVASFEAEDESILPFRRDLAWPAVAAGLLFGVAAARYGDGQILHWTFSTLGDSPCVSRGAGLVLGLALLVTLGGTMALSAHLLTPAVPSAPFRRFGASALALGSVLAVLGVATALLHCGPGSRSTLAGGGPFLLLGFAAAALAVATVPLLRSAETVVPHPPGEPRAWLAAGLVLAVLASLVTGYGSWQRLGTYAAPESLAALGAVLFGFAAREPIRLRVVPRILFAAALAFLLLA